MIKYDEAFEKWLLAHRTYSKLKFCHLPIKIITTKYLLDIEGENMCLHKSVTISSFLSSNDTDDHITSQVQAKIEAITEIMEAYYASNTMFKQAISNAKKEVLDLKMSN